MGMRRQISIGAATILAAMCFVGCAPNVPNPMPVGYAAITPDNFTMYVNTICSLAPDGRMAGSAGAEATAEYVAGRFKSIGLRGGGDEGGYFQKFRTPKVRLAGADCSLSAGKASEVKFKLDEDYYPVAFGGQGRFTGKLVVAGFGWANKITGHDSYKGLNVKDTVVLVCDGTPLGADKKSIWWGKGGKLRKSLLESKIELAASHGAAAMLIFSPVENNVDDVCDLDQTLGQGQGSIPVVRITLAAARRLWLSSDVVKNFDVALEELRTGKDVAMATSLDVAGRVDLVEAVPKNVIGILPATVDAKNSPVIVIGAHYDHLPPSGELARDCGIGSRQGADDNASGLAGMLMLAESLSAEPARNCTYVFTAFAAEEIGFLGSKHYIEHPPLPMDRTIAMMNFDQIGRMKDNTLFVMGNIWRSEPGRCLLAAKKFDQSFKLVAVPFASASHWSDQSSFVAAGVPVLFFFTGMHEDYHTMRDTPDKINPLGGQHAIRLALTTSLICDRRVGKSENNEVRK